MCLSHLRLYEHCNYICVVGVKLCPSKKNDVGVQDWIDMRLDNRLLNFTITISSFEKESEL